MRGKNPGLTPLQIRKQLLIAESDLNRGQMVHEWETMAEEARSMAVQAGSMGSLASNAASLVAGLAGFQGKKSAPVAAKTSWLQTVLKGGGLVSTIWLAFRPRASKSPHVRRVG
jgi:hypothetical protein